MVEALDKRARQSKLRLRDNRFPYYKTYLAGQRLLTYENHLRDMFKRSEDLIRYDPYYHNVYGKRKHHSRDPEEAYELQEYTPRQPTKPPLFLDDGQPDEREEDLQVPGTSNAEAQTDPNHIQQDQPMGSKSPLPPTHSPADDSENTPDAENTPPGTSGVARPGNPYGLGDPNRRG